MKDKMVHSRNALFVAMIKLMLDRVGGYVGYVSFGMVLYLYAIKTPFGIPTIYWLIMLAIGIPITIIFDWLWIYPASIKINFGRMNSEFQELRNDIRLLNEKMDTIRKELCKYKSQQ
jgi:hypothetical protein